MTTAQQQMLEDTVGLLEGDLILAEIEKMAMQDELERLRKIVGEKTVPAPIQMESMPANLTLITKDEMRALLLSKPGYVEAALLCLWSYQEQEERVVGGHWVKNGRGFSKKHIGDARRMINWIESGYTRDEQTGQKYRFRLLTNSGGKPWAILAKQMVMSYAKQLAEIACERGNLDFLKTR